MKVLHWIGGAIVVLAVYDMVSPNISALPNLPSLPTANNMTNLVIGGALFAVPFFI